MVRQIDLKGRNDVPNLLLTQFFDDSLSPVAEAGDFGVVAQYMSPADGDIVTYQYKGKFFARWWRLAGAEVIVTDAEGNQEALPLSDVVVLGVVIEVKRPISHGRPA